MITLVRAAIGAAFGVVLVAVAVVADPGFAAIVRPTAAAHHGLVVTDQRQQERVLLAAHELPPELGATTATSGAAAGDAGATTDSRSPVLRDAPSQGTVLLTGGFGHGSLAGLPATVSAAHYLRTLDGVAEHDRPAMQLLGYEDASAHPSGAHYLVLLDIGGQVPGGVRLSNTQQTVSYPALVAAIEAYLVGYAQAQHPDAPVLVAVGANNDLATSEASGREWGRDVVEPLSQFAARFPGIEIAGADDIEPGFAADATASVAWVRGFLGATGAQLVFNGSADGCSTTSVASTCHKDWTARDLAYVAGTAAPDRILVLPQIYNTDMAYQWAFISRTAMLDGHPPLRFLGPLTETVACGADPLCPTMPSEQAWAVLDRALREVHPALAMPLPVRTDLDVR